RAVLALRAGWDGPGCRPEPSGLPAGWAGAPPGPWPGTWFSPSPTRRSLAVRPGPVARRSGIKGRPWPMRPLLAVAVSDERRLQLVELADLDSHGASLLLPGLPP